MPREVLSILCFTESFSGLWGMLKSENNLPSHMLCASVGHPRKFPFDFFLLSLNFDVQGPGCKSLCTFLLGLESHLPPFHSPGAMYPLLRGACDWTLTFKYLVGPRNLLFSFSLHISKTSSEFFISSLTLAINSFAGGPADSHDYYSPSLSFWTLTER